MNLLDLKVKVDSAIEYAEACGRDISGVSVTANIKNTEGDQLSITENIWMDYGEEKMGTIPGFTVSVVVDKILDKPGELFEHSGHKYLREIVLTKGKFVDVYAVLDAFDVRGPGRQHSIKKLLCSGIRGKATLLQDMEEARDAIVREIQIIKLKKQNKTK